MKIIRIATALWVLVSILLCGLLLAVLAGPVLLASALVCAILLAFLIGPILLIDRYTGLDLLGELLK